MHTGGQGLGAGEKLEETGRGVNQVSASPVGLQINSFCLPKMFFICRVSTSFSYLWNVKMNLEDICFFSIAVTKCLEIKQPKVRGFICFVFPVEGTSLGDVMRLELETTDLTTSTVKKLRVMNAASLLSFLSHSEFSPHRIMLLSRRECFPCKFLKSKVSLTRMSEGCFYTHCKAHQVDSGG